MSAFLNVRTVVVAGLLAMLALLPLYTGLAGNTFLLTLFTRILILAMAAASLNLILGYGGMVSFGHAAYLGIGGYAVGILAMRGSLPASSSGRSRSPFRRCSRSSPARSACARAASISS